jgi:DNA segregation ATPase FtsK/SpoIIIE, S-DNA-T family
MKIELQKAFTADKFVNKQNEILLPIGFDSKGDFVFENLSDLRSIIMAGSTGSGKSNFAHSIILSLLEQSDSFSLLLFDSKKVEFSHYKNLSCLIGYVYADYAKMMEQLEVLNNELKLRYTRKNQGVDVDKFYKIVLIIDEYSGLSSLYKEKFKKNIINLAHKGSGVNIFTIIYTSRPSPVETMPKDLRNAFFTKIAFSTASTTDSNTIIDQIDAQKLLGHGDMLFSRNLDPLKRLCGFYVDLDKIKESLNGKEVRDDSEYYDKAKEVVVKADGATTALLQRRLKIGYPTAARLLDYLIRIDFVTPREGNKPGKVIGK